MRARPFFVLSCALTFAATAAFADGLSYRDVRSDHPSVGAAIATMPANGLNGTLDRLSVTIDRAVASVPPGQSSQLSAATVRQLVSGLRNLERDLSSGLPSLDLAQRLVILQVVDGVVAQPLVALHADQPWVACDEPCDRAPVLVALDRVIAVLSASVREAIREWRAANGLPPGPEEREVHPDSFGAWVDDVMADCGVAIGVESIDG